MYLNSKSIQGDKTSSIINHYKGSVAINVSKINVNWNSYTKRDKFMILKLIFGLILDHYILIIYRKVFQYTSQKI